MPFSTVPEEQSKLSCVVDGMDMMKFRCPQNVGDSKELADLWRPKLHGIGCQIDGVVECIYVMDADQKEECQHYVPSDCDKPRPCRPSVGKERCQNASCCDVPF